MEYGDRFTNSPPYFCINFQEGPVRDSGTNGCQTPNIIEVLITELERLNVGELATLDSTQAILHLREAKKYLDARTHDRMARDVEGTSAP